MMMARAKRQGTRVSSGRPSMAEVSSAMELLQGMTMANKNDRVWFSTVAPNGGRVLSADRVTGATAVRLLPVKTTPVVLYGGPLDGQTSEVEVGQLELTKDGIMYRHRERDGFYLHAEGSDDGE